MYSLTLPSEANKLVELQWNSTPTPIQELLRISDAFALERKEQENQAKHSPTKDLISTGLSLDSWLREVISREEMELVVRAFMDQTSMMKT